MSATSAVHPLPRIAIFPASPWRMQSCLVASDAAAMLAAVGLAVAAKFAIGQPADLFPYLRLWPFLFVFLCVYAAIGLYSGVALSPQEELRRSTLSSAVVFFTMGAVTVSFRGATTQFTWTLLVAIAFAIALVPIFRAATRARFGASPWWGFPAVVFGAGAAAQRAIRAMQLDPGIGLRPVAVLDDHALRHPVAGVPVIHSQHLEACLEGVSNQAYGIVILSGAPTQSRARIDEFARRFSHLLIVPELVGFSSYWVNEKCIGGNWSLEVCQKPSLPEYLRIKRGVDLLLCLLAAPAVLLLTAVIALFIRLDSPGPVFYGHRRIGRDGRPFRVFKFRSMAADADRLLASHLAENPTARDEWDRTHKLTHDPRVTRAGEFLRKTSLDELPQLWNVLRGEMSLVGPRPIVDAEAPKYGASIDLYKSVYGGITGLWQVSGRNDTTYEERVNLDSFYARNWSVWLDFCILFRTIGAVLFRKGAY
jgi:Undecaprenyl-phosphate galactose phosphotransferase WbaP